VCAVVAFSASTVVFLAYAWWRTPDDFRLLRGRLRTVWLVNVMTAAAWLGFLYSLRHLEPAVVTTLYNGAGPLTVLAMGTGFYAQTRRTSGETAAYVGLAAALVGLAVIVLAGQSGLPSGSAIVQASAIAGAGLGGVAITVSYLYTRRLNDAGVSTEAGLGVSFFLTLVVAGGLELAIGTPEMRPAAGEMAWLTAVAFLLIVLPAMLVRIGVKRSSPLAANAFRTLGPVCVLAVQQFDGRLVFSGWTLACIIAFCVGSIAASIMRFWSERRAR
jgi:drug/metabolite transporter (DMT)-like permease